MEKKENEQKEKEVKKEDDKKEKEKPNMPNQNQDKKNEDNKRTFENEQNNNRNERNYPNNRFTNQNNNNNNQNYRRNEQSNNQSYFNNNRRNDESNNQSNYERKKGKKYDLNEEKELKKVISENSEIIEEMKNAYPEISKLDCAKIFKKIKGNDSSYTIFELMNKIHRDVSNEITLNKIEESKVNLFQIDPYEIIDSFYNIPEHVHMMKYYKIYSFEDKDKLPPYLRSSLTDNYFYDKNREKEERRRKLIKYSDGSFNYIPINCQKGKECHLTNCPYSHNDNENYYHSLYYKTTVNAMGKNKNTKLFKDATDLFTDFRIIYNYKNENIINLMKLFEEKKISKYSYKEYMKNKITSFSLETFKTIECPSIKTGITCAKDPHLCYYYHNISEKRRPPSLYCYTNEMCSEIKIVKDRLKERCKNGDFCNKCHSRYEYNYHKLFFGKAMTCIRQKVKGKCIFEETCYAYHPYKEPGYKRTREEILQEKKDEIISKNNEEFDLLEKLIKGYKCQKCEKFRTKLKYRLIMGCDHVICSNCFEKVKKCPICNIKIKKEKEGEDFVEIDFSTISKDIDKLVKKNYENRKQEEKKEENSIKDKDDKDVVSKEEKNEDEKEDNNDDNENNLNSSM